MHQLCNKSAPAYTNVKNDIEAIQSALQKAQAYDKLVALLNEPSADMIIECVKSISGDPEKDMPIKTFKAMAQQALKEVESDNW
jgi:hypothetical protein